jgi:hypothetical protein
MASGKSHTSKNYSYGMDHKLEKDLAMYAAEVGFILDEIEKAGAEMEKAKTPMGIKRVLRKVGDLNLRLNREERRFSQWRLDSGT